MTDDIEEIRKLPQRYARAIDVRDIDAVGALFHPDAVVDGARGSSPIGPYLENLRNAERVFEKSMHFLGDPLIELPVSADAGTLDTYAVVYQIRAAASADDDLMLGIRYVDNVVRHEGRWVIMHRTATTMWTKPLHR